jgi:hypothetical protein
VILKKTLKIDFNNILFLYCTGTVFILVRITPTYQQFKAIIVKFSYISHSRPRNLDQIVVKILDLGPNQYKMNADPLKINAHSLKINAYPLKMKANPLIMKRDLLKTDADPHPHPPPALNLTLAGLISVDHLHIRIWILECTL